MQPVDKFVPVIITKRCSCEWMHQSKVLQMQTEEEVLPGEAPGDAPFRIHALSVLNKGRYVRTLLPRLPPQVVMSSLALQLWDSQRGKDQMLECAHCCICMRRPDVRLLVATLAFDRTAPHCDVRNAMLRVPQVSSMHRADLRDSKHLYGFVIVSLNDTRHM